MIYDEITLFEDCADLSKSLNKYSCECEIENEDQVKVKSFIEEYDEDEKFSKELSFLITTMEESTTDSINIHVSEVNNENMDEEKEELFMIINRRSLDIPLKPRSLKQGSFSNNAPSFTNEQTKQKSSNLLIHRPIPRKKS